MLFCRHKLLHNSDKSFKIYMWFSAYTPSPHTKYLQWLEDHRFGISRQHYLSTTDTLTNQGSLSHLLQDCPRILLNTVFWGGSYRKIRIGSPAEIHVFFVDQETIQVTCSYNRLSSAQMSTLSSFQFLLLLFYSFY